ncbi:MAG: TerB family tellurite resistance protein [Myxococcota bacterium]
MSTLRTRGIGLRRGKGRFFCPTCRTERPYVHRRVRRFVTVFQVPVIPLDLLGEYVECRTCRGTFRAEVTRHGPATEPVEAEFHVAVRRVMIQMMLADGVIDDQEIEAIARFYRQVTDRALSPERIRAEAAELSATPESLTHYVDQMRGQLNDYGKEIIIRAALSVASADGHFSEEEKRFLTQLGAAMEMSAPHMRGVLQASGQA